MPHLFISILIENTQKRYELIILISSSSTYWHNHILPGGALVFKRRASGIKLKSIEGSFDDRFKRGSWWQMLR